MTATPKQGRGLRRRGSSQGLQFLTRPHELPYLLWIESPGPEDRSKFLRLLFVSDVSGLCPDGVICAANALASSDRPAGIDPEVRRASER